MFRRGAIRQECVGIGFILKTLVQRGLHIQTIRDEFTDNAEIRFGLEGSYFSFAFDNDANCYALNTACA